VTAGAGGLSAADDSFHPPASDDPWWTETAWFGFSVPERGLAGAVYPLFRPNLGVCAAGVHVWDATGEAAQEVRYSRTWWHLPMPDHDLTEMRLPMGLRYDRLEPLQRYALAFADEELELELEFDGLHAPFAPLTGPTGHLDQAGRVRGQLRLHGERIEVDGFEMRDRSWSVRADQGPVAAGYDYAIAGPDRVLQVTPLTSGTRTVERVRGRPVRVRLEVVDAAGREVEARGEVVSRFAFASSPNYFAWMGLTRWELDGLEAWGQDQDVWSPDRLRLEARAASEQPTEDSKP
jgi:hypothetical protein